MFADDDKTWAAAFSAELERALGPTAGGDEDAEEALPGVFALVLLDVGCVECGETTIVRGIWTDPADGALAFDRERRRLELTRCGEIDPEEPGAWRRFRLAGGSLVLRWGHYRRPDREDGDPPGHRMLALVAARLNA